MMNCAFYIYDPDLRDLGELYETGLGEMLLGSVYFVLCNPTYIVRCQIELEK